MSKTEFLTLNIIRHALAQHISTLRKELAALKTEEQKEAEFAYYLRYGKFPE